MAYQIKSNRIDTLEPSKLSESIKSKAENDKINTNIDYETYYAAKAGPSQHIYKETTKKTVTQTQEIYGSQEVHPQDTRFKKAKDTQISKLNQLKKQYEILRNIKIDDSFVYDQKAARPESSGERSEKSVASQKSVPASTKQRQPQNGLAEFEKKQLELMLANSMNKIEDLLKAEVEYKRRIHELTRLNPESSNDKYEQKLKMYENSDRVKQETVQNLQLEQQKLKNINFNLSEKIRSIESENFNLETEIRRINDEKRRLEQSMYVEKESHMSTKIEVKRFQLERDMVERQKNSEAQRSKKIISDLNNQISRLQSKVTTQLAQIQDLGRKLSEQARQSARVSQAPKKIQSFDRQKDRERQRQAERQRQLDRLKQKEKLSNENLQRKIKQKLKQIQRSDEQNVRSELNALKEEVEMLRSQHEDNNDKASLLQRISALERKINEDNEEKIGFFEELSRTIRDFHELEQENDQIRSKLKKAYKQIEQLKQNTLYDMERLEKTQRLTISAADNNIEEINNYLTKIRRLQAENRDLKVKLTKFEDSFSNSESKTDEKIRDYSRRIQESEFQIQKLVKQNQFNLQIAEAKYKAQIELNRNDVARAIKERNDDKMKYEEAKNLLQTKNQSLRKDNQHLQELSSTQLKNKEGQITELKKIASRNEIMIREEYENKLFSLLARLDEVVRSNERYVLENTRLINGEGELYDLRQKVRKMMGYSEAIDHLWQVKEAEYSNVNSLLQEFKNQ